MLVTLLVTVKLGCRWREARWTYTELCFDVNWPIHWQLPCKYQYLRPRRPGVYISDDDDTLLNTDLYWCCNSFRLYYSWTVHCCIKGSLHDFLGWMIAVDCSSAQAAVSGRPEWADWVGNYVVFSARDCSGTTKCRNLKFGVQLEFGTRMIPVYIFV